MSDLPLTNISLFAGVGGLDRGAKMVGGFRTVAYVEYDRYAQAVLMSRMRSKELDDAPIFEDVRTFDGRSLKGRIGCVSGGFPCTDVSLAGKRGGIKEGTRSGLWSEFARIIREVEPRGVLVENVPGLLSIDDGRGFGTVLGDLAALGYDAEWDVLSAADVGAPHLRERVWVVAWKRDLYCPPPQWPTPSAGKITQSGELVNSDGTPWDGVSKPYSAKTMKPVQTALTDAVVRWPTPVAQDAAGARNATARRPNGNGKHHSGVTMTDALILNGDMEMPPTGRWPTPNTSPERPNEGNVRMLRANVLDGTMTEAEAEAEAMLNGKSVFEAQGKIPPAESSPEMFPTPTARDSKDTDAPNRGGGQSLCEAVRGRRPKRRTGKDRT